MFGWTDGADSEAINLICRKRHERTDERRTSRIVSPGCEQPSQNNHRFEYSWSSASSAATSFTRASQCFNLGISNSFFGCRNLKKWQSSFNQTMGEVRTKGHHTPSMRHISSLPYNAVSLLYVLVLSHHKSMVLYRGGPLCQSLHVLESCPVFF